MAEAANMRAPGAESDLRTGLALVLGSAIVWSFGGAIARYIAAPDPWTIVFWRATTAAAFLLLFLVLRDGLRGTIALLGAMRLPSLGVALCFATASSSFVVALEFTTVANILFFQAAGPMIAALLAWLFLGERVSRATALAIFGVAVGIGVMVSGSLSGRVSPVGDGLALVIVTAFACATVITRAHAHVRMVPAVVLAMALAALLAAALASTLAVSAPDLGFLVLFGAFNLGLGLAFFTAGARRVPSALAALAGMAEPLLGPFWAWLAHAEVPEGRTLLGGAIMFAVLFVHIGLQLRAAGAVSRRAA